MNTIQRIIISSSVGYPDVIRKIAIIGKNEDYARQSVTLICSIEHYAPDGVTRLGAFKAIEKDPFLLVADNTSIVNPDTGALILGGEPLGVGQYTWLKQAVENGANPFVLSEAAVLEADGYGRFN